MIQLLYPVIQSFNIAFGLWLNVWQPYFYSAKTKLSLSSKKNSLNGAPSFYTTQTVRLFEPIHL